MERELILTGASSAYESSLLAMVGSLNLNWPGHPRVLVYDLGMGSETLSRLSEADVEVRKVPEFCPHWRKHFAWKIWCCNDAPCEAYLWLDAGVCVLRPIDEALASITALGYFCPALNYPLRSTVCHPLRIACGLTPEDLDAMSSLNGGVHGFSKQSAGGALLSRAMELALNEENIRATEPLSRHDQAILSVLLYHYFQPVLFADFLTYSAYESPCQAHAQKVWHHRRRMLPEDQEHFAQHLSGGGAPYMPKPLPSPTKPSLVMRLRIQIARLRGRAPRSDRAGKSIYDGVRD